MRKVFVLFTLLICASLISALYEEEAGRNDWYKEFIGTVSHVVQLPQNQQQDAQHLNRLFFVATKKNVVAAVSIRTGEIAWRRVLTESIQTLKQTGSDQLMVLTADCTNIKTFNFQGFPVWNDILSEKSSSHCQIKPHNQYAAVLSENLISFRNIDNGAALWTFPRESDSTTFFSFLDAPSSNTISFISLEVIDKVVMSFSTYTLDVVSGKAKDKKTTNLKSPVSIQSLQDVIVTKDGTLIFLDRTDNHIVIAGASSEQTISSEDSLQNVELLESDNSVVLRDILTHTLTEVNVKQLTLQRVSEVFISGQVKATFAEKQLKFVLDKDEQSVDWNVEERGYPVQVYVQPFSGQQASGNRIIILAEDSSITVVQSNKVLWTREEALAHVQSTEFVDLPAKMSISHADKDLLSFPTRIAYQVKQIQAFIQRLTENKEAAAKRQNENVRDKYAFDKYIILATQPGKVFALRTRDGSIAWSLFYPSLTDKPLSVPASSRLFRLTKSAEESTLLAIVISSAQQTHVATIDTITAKVSQKITLPKIVHVAVVETSGHQPLVLFDEDLRANVYNDAENILKSYTKPIYFYLVQNNGQIIGYQWSANKEQATLVWNVQFANEIVAIDKHDNSAFYSVVHITGASDVLHKYINPHLLGVATLTKADLESTVKRIMDIFLVDTVTGEIVYRIQQDNVEGPVALHLDDNLVVCHYLRQKEKRYEVLTLELYQNDTSIERSFVGALLGANSREQTFSAYQLPKPFAIRQAFVFPTGARTISSSRTKLGITSKSFLFGLTTNQVLAIPKKMIDARRPTGTPSAADQEEGLVPYHPVLPLDGTSIISYNRTIHNIEKIDTADSQLESTSHVLVHGVDLFYTRISPAQSYDLLNEDFSYNLLLLTVGGLLIVTMLARRWAISKEKSRAWQ